MAQSKVFKGQASVPLEWLPNRKGGGTDGNRSHSDGMETKSGSSLTDQKLEGAGFQTNGYIVKKGTPFQLGASIEYVESRPLNRLPPGMFIDNQDVCDIRDEPFKEIVDTMGYPGDGWVGGGSDKLGR